MAQDAVTFTAAELHGLQTIVVDWMNAAFLLRPYPPEIAAAIEKLGIPEELVSPGEESALRLAAEAAPEAAAPPAPSVSLRRNIG